MWLYFTVLTHIRTQYQKHCIQKKITVECRITSAEVVLYNIYSDSMLRVYKTHDFGFFSKSESG